ncbi:LysR family transcriptional regulator [Pusillimonas caeni]|uniref:LysR family transcriptional regulator n=1 Tax=Pusillimonas caeni TaxID=1348472 RepID=UPI000E59ED3C|nr:LysR family transcriptional regulator [Pusillimonas caeni]TFL14246.1 LysR family transcriptional regulator [Pusillimonas caeni]
MNLLTAIEIFVRVAHSGSFSATGREFGLTQSAVSKHVAQLEAHLGVRLLNRTTRRMRLTEEGLSYLGFATKVLDDLSEAEASVGKAKAAPGGLVRISSPASFAREILVPKVNELLQQYPDLRIELLCTDLSDNLVVEGADLAIRFGEQSGTVIARGVGTACRAAVASPAYLRQAGSPNRAEDLSIHNCLLYSNPLVNNVWSFARRGKTHRIAVSGSFSSNNAEIIRAACLSGTGIALMPDWLFLDDLRTGRLQRVLKQYEPEGMPIFITYASRRFVPPKLRVVLDFLTDEMKKTFTAVGEVATSTSAV